jgi:hypothetical protein
MTDIQPLLSGLWSLAISLVRSLKIAHPNRLPVAPFYGVSRMRDVPLPKRIPASRFVRSRAH